MLSKVLRRADAAAFQPISLPGIGSRSLAVESTTRGHSDDPPWIDRVRDLEGRLVSEREAGFQAGRREAEATARAELQPVLQRLAASAAEIASLRSDLRHRAEADVIRMALMIAKKILHRTVAVDEGALTALARVAFEHLTRSESYRITVHPKFAQAISAALPPGIVSRTQIDADAACDLGTLVVRCAEGTVDASVDAQLNEIEHGLADRLALPQATLHASR